MLTLVFFCVTITITRDTQDLLHGLLFLEVIGALSLSLTFVKPRRKFMITDCISNVNRKIKKAFNFVFKALEVFYTKHYFVGERCFAPSPHNCQRQLYKINILFCLIVGKSQKQRNAERNRRPGN